MQPRAQCTPFEIGTRRASGVGIKGMRERLQQMGALEINSNGRGTVVEARLPIAPPRRSLPKSSLRRLFCDPAFGRVGHALFFLLVTGGGSSHLHSVASAVGTGQRPLFVVVLKQRL